MLCHKCGKENEDAASFCNNCATALVVSKTGTVTGIESAERRMPALSPISICAALLTFSFFLPWVSIKGINASGYQISELAQLLNLPMASFVWLVPASGVILLLASIYRRAINSLAILAGIISLGGFIFLCAALYENGFGDYEYVSALGMGAWIMLVLGALLTPLGMVGAIKGFRTRQTEIDQQISERIGSKL